MSDYRSIYESIGKSREISMNNFLDDAIKKAQKEFVDNHKVIKIPQPGAKVSFPVACVTGVCFQLFPSSFIFRWNTEHNCLDKWDKWNPDEGKQERTFRWWPYKHSCHLAAFYDAVTVVEEPKPEPVWKDCNFVEAVEWMKEKPNENFAKWNGCEYWMSNNHIWRKQTGALLNYNINAVLGKWQIKVEG